MTLFTRHFFTFLGAVSIATSAVACNPNRSDRGQPGTVGTNSDYGSNENINNQQAGVVATGSPTPSTHGHGQPGTMGGDATDMNAGASRSGVDTGGSQSSTGGAMGSQGMGTGSTNSNSNSNNQ